EVAKIHLQMLDADARHHSLRKFSRDGEQHGAGKGGDEGVAVELQGEGLHQHHHPCCDDHRGDRLPQAAPDQAAAARGGSDLVGRPHLRTAPNVMPRSRWRRSSTVNRRIGIRTMVVPAATAGQSCPPSPMMMGMKGGAVCASPEVSSTAKAYSFQAKIRQKIAVATMPVVACGSTTLRKACSRV